MFKSSTELLSLGELYVSDFVSPEIPVNKKRYDLTLVFDPKYKSVKLKETVPLNTMFGKYWYRSGTNATMKKELSNIVNSIVETENFTQDSLWLDIACNDGTLLSYVPNNFIKLGIDPAEDSFLQESQKNANEIIQDYFSLDSYNRSKYKNKKASVITCIAMFYDLEQPLPFLRDVYSILDDNGIFVLQMSYTPLMIKQLAFDNICHEHVYYWSLESLKKLLNEVNFEIVDCQLNDVNGGSFRIYVKKSYTANTYSTAPYRDVCKLRIESILNWEEHNQVNTPQIWEKFYRDIKQLKKDTVNFIKTEKAKGKIICGYGASTKGNTLLQYFGLDNSLITAIAERSPYKFGLQTIGTNIPIKSEEEVRKMKPDYMLILPWHFINEFIKREEEFLNAGGAFIVPCPKFNIYRK